MAKFTIDTDVPSPDTRHIPGSGRGRPKGSGYPFEEMLVGQSFFVPRKKTFSLAYYNKKFAKEHTKFVSRVAELDGVSGVRIWLVGTT